MGQATLQVSQQEVGEPVLLQIERQLPPQGALLLQLAALLSQFVQALYEAGLLLQARLHGTAAFPLLAQLFLQTSHLLFQLPEYGPAVRPSGQLSVQLLLPLGQAGDLTARPLQQLAEFLQPLRRADRRLQICHVTEISCLKLPGEFLLLLGELRLLFGERLSAQLKLTAQLVMLTFHLIELALGALDRCPQLLKLLPCRCRTFLRFQPACLLSDQRRESSALDGQAFLHRSAYSLRSAGEPLGFITVQFAGQTFAGGGQLFCLLLLSPQVGGMQQLLFAHASFQLAITFLQLLVPRLVRLQLLT